MPSYAVGFISIAGKLECLLLLCSLMMYSSNRVHCHPMGVFVCFHNTLLHYHHYADISEGIGLLKCLSGTFRRVWV